MSISCGILERENHFIDQIFELNVDRALLERTAKSHMHEQGIEPLSNVWQARILPLNHSCSVQIVKQLKVGDGEEQSTLQVRQQIMQLNTNQA